MLKLQVQHNSISRQMFQRIWFYSREAFEVAVSSVDRGWATGYFFNVDTRLNTFEEFL